MEFIFFVRALSKLEYRNASICPWAIYSKYTEKEEIEQCKINVIVSRHSCNTGEKPIFSIVFYVIFRLHIMFNLKPVCCLFYFLLSYFGEVCTYIRRTRTVFHNGGIVDTDTMFFLFTKFSLSISCIYLTLLFLMSYLHKQSMV